VPSGFGFLPFLLVFVFFGASKAPHVFVTSLAEEEFPAAPVFNITFRPFFASWDAGEFRFVILVLGKSRLGWVSFGFVFGAFLDQFFRLGFPTT